MGRLLVRFFVSLIQSSTRQGAGDRGQVDVAIMQMHAALKAACPKYAADVCFADVPLPPEPAPKPPVGTWGG